MSNFPPGVTGNEPQIAGVPEGTRYVKCPSMCCASRLTVTVRSAVQAREVVALGAPVAWRLSDYGVDEIECPFEGAVDGYFDGDEFVMYGECPVCGDELRVPADEATVPPPRRSRR